MPVDILRDVFPTKSSSAKMVHITDEETCPRCRKAKWADGHTTGSRIGGSDFIVCSNEKVTASTVEIDITDEELHESWYHANGPKLCDICGRDYDSHPLISNLLDSEGDPYLNFLCNGDIIKL